jgi:mRNA interferase HigB
MSVVAVNASAQSPIVIKFSHVVAKDTPKGKAAEGALKAWFAEAKAAQWASPQDVKKQYASASIIANNRIVFNIKGNDYRLVALIRYRQGLMFIRFIGTHSQYNKIDVSTI